MTEPMPESTKADLVIAKAASMTYARDVHSCIVCGQTMRKPRYLKAQTPPSKRGSRYVTYVFCSQECHDAYVARFRLPGPRWPKFDQEGALIGFVVPKRRFVPLSEIDVQQDQEA